MADDLTRRTVLSSALSVLPAAGLTGALLLSGRCGPSPELAKQALRARAEALISDFEEAGAFFSISSRELNRLWIGVPVDGDLCDYDRVDTLKRRLHERRELYPAIVEIMHGRFPFLQREV